MMGATELLRECRAYFDRVELRGILEQSRVTLDCDTYPGCSEIRVTMRCAPIDSVNPGERIKLVMDEVYSEEELRHRRDKPGSGSRCADRRFYGKP